MAAVYKSLSKANGTKAEAPANGVRKNKQRVLILSSRGVTHRHRHLLNDLASMLPQCVSGSCLPALSSVPEVSNSW